MSGFQTMANRHRGKLLPTSMRKTDVSDERIAEELEQSHEYSNPYSDPYAKKMWYPHDERTPFMKRSNPWNQAALDSVQYDIDKEKQFNKKYWMDSYGRVRRR